MWGAVDSVQTLLEDFQPVKKTHFKKQLWYVFLLCTAIGFMDEAELEVKLKKTENRKKLLLGIQFEVCIPTNE